MDKVALVHDWLLGMRGGERCLGVLCSMFPQADIYTLFYDSKNIVPEITKQNVTVSTLGRLPFVKHYYRHLLPLYPYAMRGLTKKLARANRLEGYDVVISVSHCAAKNITTPDSTLHICYCLTPMRYIWDQYDAYFSGKRLEPLIRRVVRGMREWDVERAAGVNHFIGISDFVKDRIARVYQRPADVIYPPVATDWIQPREEEGSGEGFICVNALVPYKNVQIIIEAFNTLQLPLTIVGTGPEKKRLKRLANKNIKFIDHLSDAELAKLYQRSRALIFAAEEDFGMIPVEMQAAGRPVICLGRGGALETVNSGPTEPTGVFFSELSSEALVEAVQYFIDQEAIYTVNNCIRGAAQFSEDRFKKEFLGILEKVS